jgi:hypothetical protein
MFSARSSFFCGATSSRQGFCFGVAAKVKARKEAETQIKMFVSRLQALECDFKHSP